MKIFQKIFKFVASFGIGCIAAILIYISKKKYESEEKKQYFGDILTPTQLLSKLKNKNGTIGKYFGRSVSENIFKGKKLLIKGKIKCDKPISITLERYGFSNFTESLVIGKKEDPSYSVSSGIFSK